jgi:hypothetical protein
MIGTMPDKNKAKPYMIDRSYTLVSHSGEEPLTLGTLSIRAMKQRYTTLLIILLMGTLGWAQEPVTHFFEADQPMEEVSIRPVIEAMNNLDPYARVQYFSDDFSIFKVTVNPSVSETEVRQAIAQAGVQVKAGTPEIQFQEPVYTTPDGRPLYVVTDNPEEDRQRYQQAIQEWNMNNPNDQITMPMPAGDGNN